MKLYQKVALAAVPIAFIISPLMLFNGCAGSATKNAAAVNGAVITAVDDAMQAWAKHVNALVTPGNPPSLKLSQQIVTVSNAYNVYYNAQLTFSNVQAAYVQSPSTNLASAISTAATALANSQTNIVNIINTYIQ